jgi:phospholipase D1/2
MHTHDEEAQKKFRHSDVHCVLAPRYASNKLSIFKQQVCMFSFSCALFSNMQESCASLY